MMLAAWAMDVLLRSRWRHEGLARQDDVPRLSLLAQMVRDLRVVGLHVAEEPAQEPPRLKILA